MSEVDFTAFKERRVMDAVGVLSEAGVDGAQFERLLGCLPSRRAPFCTHEPFCTLPSRCDDNPRLKATS